MISIKLIQNRVANISIGSSAVRGQPKGTTNAVIDFLKKIDLRDFSNAKSEADFLRRLNKETNSLKNKAPWGIARKALNIFLFQATQNIHLSKKYELRNLIPYLELTLDNPNGEYLVSEASKRGKDLIWINIKHLTKENSDALQKFAKELAREKFKCERCYLDIYLWRELLKVK